MKDYLHNLNPYLREVEPDEAGPDPIAVAFKYGIPLEKLIVLSRNENPYQPGQKVFHALKGIDPNRYPHSQEFIDALSTYTRYPAENILIGSGMDEIITNIARLFLSPNDRSLIPVPTYDFYSSAVKRCGAFPIYLENGFNLDIDNELIHNAKIIFLCSPNNPTGQLIPEKVVRQIAESTQGIVFLDEAYVEFAQKSLSNLVNKFDNIVIGRTLSKAFGLAGLRLGYAIAPEWIVDHYRRILPLFGISSFSLAAGVAVLNDLAHMRKSVAKIISERDRLLDHIEGASPSHANFLFIRTEQKSKKVVEKLLSQGIIVRDCSSFLGCGEYSIRVTIGMPKENNDFLEAFNQL